MYPFRFRMARRGFGRDCDRRQQYLEEHTASCRRLIKNGRDEESVLAALQISRQVVGYRSAPPAQL